MSTHNIQFHDEIRKYRKIFVFLSNRKNFAGTRTRVRISHGKRPIRVRAIEVRLYWYSDFIDLWDDVCNAFHYCELKPKAMSSDHSFVVI